MKLINLTGRTVWAANIDYSKPHTKILAQGYVYICDTASEPVPLSIDTGGIVVLKTETTKQVRPEGALKPELGVGYIVNEEVRLTFPDRTDLFSRDRFGHLVANNLQLTPSVAALVKLRKRLREECLYQIKPMFDQWQPITPLLLDARCIEGVYAEDMTKEQQVDALKDDLWERSPDYLIELIDEALAEENRGQL